LSKEENGRFPTALDTSRGATSVAVRLNRARLITTKTTIVCALNQQTQRRFACLLLISQPMCLMTTFLVMH